MYAIRCIIIDDEDVHIDYFVKTCKTICTNVEIVGTANDVIAGIKLINRTSFDILFFDVQLPPLSGFDLLKGISHRNFDLVFTTSFDKYALEAIKFSAIEYLLKPYSQDDLQQAFEKHVLLQQKNTTQQVNALLHNINPENKKKKIGLSDKTGIEFFDLDSISYCKADNVYTTFYFDNKKEVVTSKPLKEYENELLEHNFFRIHHSHIINLNKVKKYIRGDGGQVIMETDHVLDVARNKKVAFLEKLQRV